MMAPTLGLLITLLMSLISNVSAEISDEIVKLSVRAMELVEVLQSKDASDVKEETLYRDKSNAALLVKEDDYCFAIYDTTERFSLADWGKNVDPRSSEVCALPNGPCCMARRGYARAYNTPSYKDSLEAELTDCYSSGRQVILAGHSAGGATANVAAVVLSAFDPLVITFGQPASLVGDCPMINQDEYYHWVNTDVNHGGRNLDYDPVPDLTLTVGAKQGGQRIVMSEDTKNVVFYRNGKAPSIGSWGADLGAHNSDRYLKRLKKYQGKALKTNGWAADFRCNVDEECLSNNCSGDPSYWRSGKCQD